ncbi:hypothetical protein AQUCO_03800188v1 [Aquilegia coerulea]|uniref:Uncharacterized protein n=1 Tax=Aquilegia coerulea TaxID=218851 RepID=A0A2G5CT63_AQUCA|nr:hypothetical protein AQUCO_03800188v1 [Aquilegia coerulea]
MTSEFHIAMFPWFAMGHITPYLLLSNKLAERGNQISFFIPAKTQSKLNHFNIHPHLIHPHKTYLIRQALDLTQEQVQNALVKLKPDYIFFDFPYWVPAMARPLGIKSVYFCPIFIAMNESDALCFRACNETEGPYAEFLESQYHKPVLLTGPLLPTPCNTPLEERWTKWLDSFKKGSVVYCAFGSECVLEKEQFQELVLGLEQTGLPFLVRLKPPVGANTVEEALPEGFEERVRGRGIVHGGWIQQQLILNHPSVGCFVGHCGSGSIWESLVSTCQVVLVPHFIDQFTNTKFLTKRLNIAVDVDRREEDGWFTREGVHKAVKLVMDEGSEVGEQIRANHLKLSQLFLGEGFEASYINNFILKLRDLLV